MNISSRSALLCLTTLSGGVMVASEAIAQSIAPVTGMGTIANDLGDLTEIQGGQFSQDGANQFHQFRQFDVEAGHTATFLASPAVQNVISQVVGDRPSHIHGTLGLTGGPANLYFVNPAGILFGPTARLDVPAAFMATTANRIGFASERWLDPTTMEFANLLGNPQAWAEVKGAIVNGGILAVSAGQNLTLLGNIVANTGTLAAPGGRITIAAVPHDSVLRLSQDQHLLSLEIPDPAPTLNATTLPPATLPQLLTGGTPDPTLRLTANADGTVSLTGFNTAIAPDPGTTLISGQVTAANPQGGGGTVQILGDRVILSQATVQADGLTGGGTVYIGGDRGGGGTLPRADVTWVDAESQITASAIAQGNGGEVILWSNQVTGFYGEIQARGGAIAGDGGWVEVSGREQLVFRGQVDTMAPQGQVGTLLLDPTNIVIDTVGSDPGLPEILATDLAGTDVTILATDLEQQTAAIVLQATNDIRIADGVSLTFVPSTQGITFQADADGDRSGDFRMDPTQSINTQGRSLVITGTNILAGTISTFDLDASNDGPATATTGSGGFGSDVPRDLRFPDTSGDVTLLAGQDIEVERVLGRDLDFRSELGDIRTGSLASEAGADTAPALNFSGIGSTVNLAALNGTITTRGVIRVGQTNKATDSRVTIAAQQFQALDPVREIQSDVNGDRILDANGNPVTVPMSIYVYPANVDAAPNNRFDAAGNPDPSQGSTTLGRAEIRFRGLEGSTIIGTEGNILVQIEIGRDLQPGESTNFVVTPAAGLLPDNGTLGIIGIGSERAPSAIVLLQNNVFTGTPLPVADTPVLPDPTGIPDNSPNLPDPIGGGEITPGDTTVRSAQVSRSAQEDDADEETGAPALTCRPTAGDRILTLDLTLLPEGSADRPEANGPDPAIPCDRLD